MKYFTALLLGVICVSFASARLTGQQKELLLTYGTQCAGLINVSNEELQHVREGDLSGASFNEKCWIECVFERLGILKDGNIQTSVIMDSLTGMGLDLDAATAITFKCENPRGETACDRAHDLAICYQNADASLHNKKK